VIDPKDRHALAAHLRELADRVDGDEAIEWIEATSHFDRDTYGTHPWRLRREELRVEIGYSLIKQGASKR
jgi:hypothetical protein